MVAVEGLGFEKIVAYTHHAEQSVLRMDVASLDLHDLAHVDNQSFSDNKVQS